MKKKLNILVALLSLTASLWAEPVAPGYWKIITLRDGSKMQVEYRGDEWATYWGDRLGNAYVENDLGTWDRVTIEEATRDQLAFFNSTEGANSGRHQQRKKVGLGIANDKSLFQGTKKSLVILVEYQDVSFSDAYKDFGCGSVNELYQRILNEENFTEEPFHGSVRDYFKAQSYGQFVLDFDVVGPYKLSEKRAYYGGPVYSKSGNDYTHIFRDAHVGAMITEALQAADAAGVDFTKYDWDGDGEVEEVFVIYAGQGQTDYGPAECVYNHKYSLTERQAYDSYYMGKTGLYYYSDVEDRYYNFTFKRCAALTLDGKKVDTYACGQELATRRFKDNDTGEYYYDGTQIKGIGTICHEFSHCLGYPDFYNGASAKGFYGLGKWDLMNSGTYQGSWNGLAAGYCPPAYSAFERWCAGWIEPTVLTDPTAITNLKPLSGTAGNPNDCGNAYVIYCKGNSITGEYYLLENRQWENWDACLPYHGLLISHYDYNSSAWSTNKPNSTDHERAGIVQAMGFDLNNRVEMNAYPFDPAELAERFPSGNYGTTPEEITAALNAQYGTSDLIFNTTLNNAFTADTYPAAIYYNGGNSKLAFTGHEVTSIAENKDADRTVNFVYRWPTAEQSGLTLQLDEETAEEQSFASGLYATVTLNRTFTPTNYGKWSTMWLPFSLGKAAIKAQFGEHARVAKLTSVEQTDGATNVHFTSTPNGIDAFEPFILLLDEQDGITGPFTFEQVSVGDAATTAATTVDGTTFVGTKVKTSIPEGSVFISNNLFYTSVGKSSSRAYRGYFNIARDGQSTAAYQPSLPTGSEPDSSYDIRYLDDSDWGYGINTIVDGIPLADVSRHSADDAIYDLQGRRISAATQKGIYIVNGKKMVVK